MSFKNNLSLVGLCTMGSIIGYTGSVDNDLDKRELTIRIKNVQTYEPKAEKKEAKKPDLVDQVLKEVKAEETPDWKWLYLNERNRADLAEKDRELAQVQAQLEQAQAQLYSRQVVSKNKSIDDDCGRNDAGNTQVVYYDQNGNSYDNGSDNSNRNSTGTAVPLNTVHKARPLNAKRGGNKKTSQASGVYVIQDIGNGAKVENNITVNVGSKQGTTTQTPNPRYTKVGSRYTNEFAELQARNRQLEAQVVRQPSSRGPVPVAVNNQNNRVTYYEVLDGVLNTSAAAARTTYYLSNVARDIRYIDWLFSGHGRRNYRYHRYVRPVRYCGHVRPVYPKCSSHARPLDYCR